MANDFLFTSESVIEGHPDKVWLDLGCHSRCPRPSRPIYRKTDACDHFGRKLAWFTWVRTDRAGELRKACIGR